MGQSLHYVVMAAAAFAIGGASAQASAPHRHTAACVAALKVRADALTRRLKAGESSVEAELTDVLEHGYAFIGTAYLNGFQDEAQAKAMLKQAEAEQVGLSERQLAQRQAACRSEAAKLLAETNAVYRSLVAAKARSRVEKIKRVASGA